MPPAASRRRQVSALAISAVINLGLAVSLLGSFSRQSAPAHGEDTAVVEASLVRTATDIPAPPRKMGHAKGPSAVTPMGEGETPEDTEAPGSPNPAEPAVASEDAAVLATFTPASSDAGPEKPCDLAGALAVDLAAAPIARLALDRLPPQSRSVADAVMMWDGGWPPDTNAGAKALLRAVIAREIAAARAECREQTNTGPRLFLAPGAGTTIAVALGSGTWRWSDLLR